MERRTIKWFIPPVMFVRSFTHHKAFCTAKHFIFQQEVRWLIYTNAPKNPMPSPNTTSQQIITIIKSNNRHNTVKSLLFETFIFARTRKNED